MVAPLVPCPSCRRHVTVDEASCPFCRSLLPADLARLVVPGTTRRLSRAAAFAFTTSLAASACSGEAVDTSDGGSNDAATTLEASMVSHYGLPTPLPDASSDGSTGASDAASDARSDAALDGGGVTPLYGAPVDAGADATLKDAGGIGPLYGLSPPDAAGD